MADNLVSSAQIVMGEGDEGIPAVIIRDAPVAIRDVSGKIPTIPPQECMYIGAMRCGPRPYTGGYDDLINQAKSAMNNAYAPYSGFKVGAAILSRQGIVYSAANMENASLGLGVCAERAALSKAIASGEREFEAIAIVGNHTEPVPPCGICRQSLIEFGDGILVIMANMKGDTLMAQITDLLPLAFSGRFIGKHG